MESKKYLIYDNLVRGAGIGHSLACYNYGLNMAQDKGLKFLPSLLQLGHGVGGGGVLESFLGLPNCTAEREAVLNNYAPLVHHENYDPRVNPTSSDFSKTKSYFRKAYKNVSTRECPHLNLNIINIAVSIRRGDIAMFPHSGHKGRLLPDIYFLRALDYVIGQLNSSNFFVNIYSDGDWKGNYINEKGEKVDPNSLFSKYKDRFAFHSTHKSGNTTLSQFHSCIVSDIYIASISGFSQAIQLFREDKKSFFPGFHKLPIWGDPDSIEHLGEENLK